MHILETAQASYISEVPLVRAGVTDRLSISASEPDWSREACQRWWDPSRQLLKCIRRYQFWKEKGSPLGVMMCRWYILWHRFWSAVSGADIPLNCRIEGGLLMPHPNGVVIHPNAYIGPNCLLLQQVTIVSGVRLEGHVDIGAGAKIIRPVSIGQHARVGANAVVLNDVPAFRTAVGMPAHIAEGSDQPS
jgi:serine O-acetyltransferase